MKRRLLFVLPILMALASCGNAPSNTPSDPGTDPSKEDTILHGVGAPSDTLGNDYDHYLDEDSRYVYEKNDGKWYNRFSYGSFSLYEDRQINPVKVKRTTSLSTQDLKNALMNSFYSTNATCLMSPKFADPSQSGWDFKMKWNCNTSELYVDAYDESADKYYSKVDDKGDLYLYFKESKQYVYVGAGSNYYCMVPHPTVENIFYTNYIMYDDTLGGLTAIVCGHIKEATYSESEDKYVIKNMPISHEAISTHYFATPFADNMVLDFEFSLSKDKMYAEKCFVKIVSSEKMSTYNGFGVEITFSDLHTTSFVMPE